MNLWQLHWFKISREAETIFSGGWSSKVIGNFIEKADAGLKEVNSLLFCNWKRPFIENKHGIHASNERRWLEYGLRQGKTNLDWKLQTRTGSSSRTLFLIIAMHSFSSLNFRHIYLYLTVDLWRVSRYPIKMHTFEPLSWHSYSGPPVKRTLSVNFRYTPGCTSSSSSSSPTNPDNSCSSADLTSSYSGPTWGKFSQGDYGRGIDRRNDTICFSNLTFRHSAYLSIGVGTPVGRPETKCSNNPMKTAIEENSRSSMHTVSSFHLAWNQQIMMSAC
jgi:hypothetical protein